MSRATGWAMLLCLLGGCAPEGTFLRIHNAERAWDKGDSSTLVIVSVKARPCPAPGEEEWYPLTSDAMPGLAEMPLLGDSSRIGVGETGWVDVSACALPGERDPSAAEDRTSGPVLLGCADVVVFRANGKERIARVEIASGETLEWTPF